ncbi:3-phosphoshikimate 1-carboxyvinyltransferase [Chrysochromulina tobinii]|uniref:3-phosphoshikimate 1-carboxyvinyltransferase n=1 Tax=Chrysochromulina tobinii TaxID=1460289 RepID=A0A0M0KAP7_9EUKA|nr:3-phosphoshikimate 1-carboxyvinyltransferase [Chrysochromulina tobinii]|eukprot:KOO35463.1 3-phosphoshikimate 1-carboxyvinyltransferase [Chrysochromulina sp. CCMP291]
MPLPKLIEVVPFSAEQLAQFKATKAEIVIPGSKSITNRALVLAAQATGMVTLKGALWSEDTEAMTDCMHRLGVEVDVAADPEVAANRILTVKGCGGKLPKGGTEAEPLELFVANAGTAARFLTAMVCLGDGVYRLSGVPRMHERPQKELIRALRALGYRIDTPNDMLPAVVYGGGPKPGRVEVSVEDSSQFASALLLSSRVGGWQVALSEGADPDELPYVEMTRQMTATFPHSGGTFQIEPDASSASYFHAANALFPDVAPVRVMACQPPKADGGTGWQIDAEYPRLSPVAAVPNPSSTALSGEKYLEAHGVKEAVAEAVAEVLRTRPADPLGAISGLLGAREESAAKRRKVTVSRKTDLGDAIMTAITIAPLAPVPFSFTDLGVLRKQECERVRALHDELTKCGARVLESGQTLDITPSEAGSLGRATIKTYHDHRMAMCFATLGLAVPGLKIEDPSCVRKTVPSFFQLLGAAPPGGLGVHIWECDPVSGARVRRLTEPEDLFAAAGK